MAFRRSGLDSKRGTLELERKKREELSKDDTLGGRRDDDYKLKESERTAIHSVFSIYDTDGKGSLDCSQVPDALRALGLNPTLGFVEKVAGSVKLGEKQIAEDEFIPIYAKCKADKDSGVYEDFIECLKLYDKDENGMIQLAELTHALLSLGERLNDNELDSVLTDCMDPEDDEGFIPYIHKSTNTAPYVCSNTFLARMCEKPVPKSIKPL